MDKKMSGHNYDESENVQLYSLSKSHSHCHPKEFEYGQLINEGSFAKIYAVRNISTKEEFALKIAYIDDISERQSDQFMSEVLMLRQLEHPNIIRIEACWLDFFQLSVLFPLMAHLSCAAIVQNRFSFGISEHAMGQILAHILPAVEYLHERKIIHRSIKGSHILVNHNGIAILTGFKFAINSTEGGDNFTSSSDLTNMTKCLNWLSPEIIAQDRAGYSFNADVYSLGITILELCNGVVPFAEMTPAAILVKKIKLSSPKLWDLNHLPSKENMQDQPSTSMQAQFYSDDSQDEDMFSSHGQATEKDRIYAKKFYSKDFQNFTSLCLINDKISRPSIMQLKKHKFMKGHFNLDPNNLIKSLTLNDGIHFLPSSAGDHAVLPKPVFSSELTNFEWDFE